MYYNRQIIYIDYMEAGSKVKNAGFLKKEETEDTITWNLQIKGLYETDTGFFDLRDETGALIDKVLLKRGSGFYERQFAAGGVSRGGRDFGEICGITIRLSPGREVIGRWKGREKWLKAADFSEGDEKTGNDGMLPEINLEIKPQTDLRQREPQMQEISLREKPEVKPEIKPEVKPEMKPEVNPRRAGEQRKELWQYRKRAAEGDAEADSMEAQSGLRFSEKNMDSVMENGSVSAEKLCRRCMYKRFAPQEKKQEAANGAVIENIVPIENIIPMENGISGGSGGHGEGDDLKDKAAVLREKEADLMQEEFFEDKWEQLRHMYPAVHPFADEREYLSVTPRDFVVLSSEYQKMVRNSFLLHGYYNYRHLILGKFNVGGVEKFYLGVPGVYYDREKMAAEMFGFEAFEGRQTPAEQGSFGYYMKSVRI